MNDECKDIIKSTQSLDDVPKQVNVPITKLVDCDFFEKLDHNITVPYISKPIEVMPQVQLKYTIVKDPNILK